MENLITLRQHEAEFFGGMDYAARRDAVEAAHSEALLVNRIWNARNANTQAERLSAESGFTVAQCLAELDAEERDYFAALHNLRCVVADAHAEALEMDKQATHFRKEQAALTQRVAVIIGKGSTPEVNTAPV